MPPGVKATFHEVPGTSVCFLWLSSSTREAVLRYRRREVRVFGHLPELREEEVVGESFPRDCRAADRAAPHPDGGEEGGGDRRYPG